MIQVDILVRRVPNETLASEAATEDGALVPLHGPLGEAVVSGPAPARVWHHVVRLGALHAPARVGRRRLGRRRRRVLVGC